MKFDASKFSQLDWAIVGGAGVAFIAGFLPWYGYSRIYGASISGWSSGFTAWAGTLLLTLAGTYLFLRRSGVSLPTLPVGPAVVVAGVAAIGLLLVIIRWLTFPTYPGIGLGTKFGIYLALIAGIVEVGAAVLEFRASGEPLPWAETPTTPSEPSPPEEQPAAEG